MGARVSISFVTGNEESVVLFCHWGGPEFVEMAKKYAKKLVKEVGTDILNPLDRLEPNTVMVDFIREITKNEERIKHNYYLGATENDGDNSDFGHHKIKLTKQRGGKVGKVSDTGKQGVD
jgi:hypothetical protein